MNTATLDIDRERVRWLFARPGVTGGDFILREISARMFERLDYIKLDAKRVLDAGCGAGADLEVLAKRFPRARLTGLDQRTPAAVDTSRSPTQRLRQLLRSTTRPERLVADLGVLPLANASVDLIWSNLALHWHPAPHTVFPEWRRCLQVNGLVLFSVFGPDTLKEVRDAFALADPRGAATAHVPAFTDLHDYGDMLVAAGFATPVMDAERLTLTYSNTTALWKDVRGLGGNPAAQRRRGLMGKAMAARLAKALEACRGPDGLYRLSFEIVYGHAWNPPVATVADGRSVIHFDPRQRPPRI